MLRLLLDGRTAWTRSSGQTGLGVNVLAAPGTLTSGRKFPSHTGALALTMQADGNLVLASVTTSVTTGAVLWSSNTANNLDARAVMQTDGNVVIYRANNTAAWATGAGGGPTSRLQLYGTGLFRILHPSVGALYSTPEPSPFDPFAGPFT